MTRVVFSKFIFICLSLLALVTFTFALLKFIPGDPFQQEQALPEKIHEELRSHYGLNDKIYIQYIRYLKQLFTFDFGPSIVHKGQKVSTIIAESFPNSALLGCEALTLAIPLGLLFGITAALKQNKSQGLLLSIFAVIGISVPSFILATLLQYVFGIKTGIFPVARWETFAHTLLPAFSLACMPIAFIARMTRARVIEELHQGYVTTARAKGFPETFIILFHVMRNVLSPILSYLGPLSANILTGSFIVEKIYSVPGLGYWFVTSVLNRDYPLIMGITVFYCVLLLLATFIVDILCLMIDPRRVEAIRYKGAK